MTMKNKSVLGAQIEVSVEKTRPADTTAYTNEDVISESTSAGTHWDFDAVVPTPGGSGKITKAVVLCDETAKVPVLTMYLTNVAPTGNLDDNAANTNPVYATESDNYQGKIDWAALEDLGGPSEATLVSADLKMPIPFVCAAGDDSLFGVLVVRSAAHTPTSGEKYRVTLTIKPD